MQLKFFWDENPPTVHSERLSDRQIIKILEEVKKEVNTELSKDVEKVIKQINNNIYRRF